MFTVELESDHSIITCLDNSGEFEDIQVIIEDDNKVFLRQWDDARHRFIVLQLTYQQLKSISVALNMPEGTYNLELVNEQ